MADISKINPNGTEYNLKDATARSGIESAKTIKSSVVTVTDAAPINAEDITVDITPIQDLHGYDRPWAGGAGKNKLPMTVDGIKAVNTDGTWNGNIYTNLNLNVEILTDSDNNVTGLKISGTNGASDKYFILQSSFNWNRALTINGCPSGGSASTYCLGQSQGAWDYGSGAMRNTTNTNRVAIWIAANYTCPLGGLLFKPMIRDASITDATFAPYSNICHIEGWTGAELDRVGKNLWKDGNVTATTYNAVAYTPPRTGDYTFSAIVTTNSDNKNCLVRFCEDSSGNVQIGEITILADGARHERTATLPLEKDVTIYVLFYASEGYAISVGKTATYSDIQLEVNEDATTYEPYQGQQYTASFGETVYGGKWHVTEGGTDKTHANIASYNGETINEPWLSSLDEYSPGATPTIGAQVVYPLTTPTTISTPKQNVPMLQGINTVYADCGDTQLKYQPDNVVGELKGEIRAVETELAEVEENLEIVYEDHVANTSMGIIVDGYSVGDMPFSNALDIAKAGYTAIAVTDTSIVHSTVATQGEIATHCLLDVTNNRVRFYVHVMDSAASLTIPPNSLTFRVAYKKA